MPNEDRHGHEEMVPEMDKITITRGPFAKLLAEGHTGEFIRLGRHRYHAWWPGQKHDLIFYRQTDPSSTCVSFDFHTGKETEILNCGDSDGHYSASDCRTGKLGFFYHNTENKLYQVNPDGPHTPWGKCGFTDYKVGSDRVVGVTGHHFYVLKNGEAEGYDLGNHPFDDWGLDQNGDVVFHKNKKFFRISLDGTKNFIGTYEFDSCRIGKCGPFNLVLYRENVFYGVDIDNKQSEREIGRYEFGYAVSVHDYDWELCEIGVIIRSEEDDELADEPSTEFIILLVYSPV